MCMVLSDWYEIDEVEENIFIIKELHPVQSYLVNTQTHSALIDTGTGLRNIRNAIKHLFVGDFIYICFVEWLNWRLS